MTEGPHHGGDAAEGHAPEGDATPVGPRWARRLDVDRSRLLPLSPAASPADELRRLADQPTEPPRSGILVVDKPQGHTSFDVVKAVRRASGERRVGHAGTLDPLATGVLVVCFGSATRVIEEIQAGHKVYAATVRLGQATTTYDSEGEVTEEGDVSGIERSDVEDALSAFRGDIMQRPPIYSALKRDGKPLYERARAGEEIEVEPRPVTVHRLELGAWTPPDLELTMTVGRGTYVRSIAHDLGQSLGCGGHLVALRRTAVGRFEIETAESLSRVVEAFVDGWWPLLTYPLDAALVDYHAMVVDEAGEADMRHGRQFDGPPPAPDTTALVRVYRDQGRFIGLARWDEVHQRWQPARVFPAPERQGA